AIYMAVCGLPEANEKHAENMIFCAKQILSFVEKYNQTSKEKIKIKIGLNSGKVIAGIVGIRKYIYDIFGDTVNTASRMETSSRAMEINVSEHTYQLVKEKFNFKKQDAIQVKGKGLMQTYYLDDK
ncbi:MAG: adenylate/guanylate cyclase domain-containing protein, partial [Treponema sp.]|nr:adenylate/guanylate cyclase domain-containing protein [Treponema sp.]